MHTTQGHSGRVYHHDARGSIEDVIHFEVIVRAQPATIQITMRDVLRLAADFIRYERIEALEDATDAEMLGLVKRSD